MTMWVIFQAGAYSAEDSDEALLTPAGIALIVFGVVLFFGLILFAFLLCYYRAASVQTKRHFPFNIHSLL